MFNWLRYLHHSSFTRAMAFGGQAAAIFPEPKGRSLAGHQEDTEIKTWKVTQTLPPCLISHFLIAHWLGLISLSLLTSLLWSPDQNSWLSGAPEDTWDSPTIWLSAPILNCQGYNFDWPSLSQLSNLPQLEVKGMFKQMVMGAISSELGSSVKRVIIC